ncbi:hypothetical protein [Riemerella columbina]|uniref:hypothetical protein n=1 Tax=Riemerella columbina TaxID=103810 RepID=UPI00266F9877|nr:hypothetical protein [Riemerella columbina]WKS94907.1 hypothetical protein NYR17_08250 [Riemerella columbina]
MMKKINLKLVLNRLTYLLALLFFYLNKAQEYAMPNNMPQPNGRQGGNIGVVGPGEPDDVPVDQYTSLLFIAGIMIIVGYMFYLRYERRLAVK